jgi:hypothetical protein
MTEGASAKLQAALQIPDKIPARQFAQILRRLAIALRNRDSSPFSDDEVQLLLEQFEITPTDFDAMFSACLYVLQQSACFCFDAERTQIYAGQSGASEAVAGCFSAVWDAEGEELIEALKQRTIADKTLDGSAWRLNLKAADRTIGASRDPVLLIDLSVSGERPITVQFDHAAISKFYAEIEEIQQQIDRLT